MRILIADDAPDARIILAKLLGKWGYDVIIANDGFEAWEILNREPIRFVISDWMMPGMDGIQLCRRIRERAFPYYVYIILLTARDERSDLLVGMNAGADDFLTKPFNRDELQVQLRAAQRILDLEKSLEDRNRHLSEVNAKLENAYHRIRTDLEAAAKMQKSLLPKSAQSVQAVRLDWLFLPASVIAGDIFNFFALDKQHLGFYHLDVAGHGIPSAMLSVTLSRVLSNDLWSGSPIRRCEPGAAQSDVITRPHDVVQELNRRFHSHDDCMLYFTMVYGFLNTETGRISVCQAGHPSPIRVSRDGGVSTIGTGGFPVGMLQEAEFDTVEVVLRPGDRLFFYSDGITECKRIDGEDFGAERLQRFLSDTAQTPLRSQLQKLQDMLRDWRGSEEFDDDISLLAMQLKQPS